jgi:hypothetical protein
VATVILVVVYSELLLLVPVDVLSSFIIYICVTRLSVMIRSDRLSPCGEHDNITIFDNDQIGAVARETNFSNLVV